MRRWIVSGLICSFVLAGCGKVSEQDADGPPACAGETAAELCTAAKAECGALDATDRCSEIRRVDCGGCTTTGEACGGGGTANACDAHPPLKAVDGYILGGNGQYSIKFATDGIPGNGGFCCGTTVGEARASYPQFNLIQLPEQSQIPTGQIPSLYKVDGYIVKHPPDPTMLEYRGATNGAMDGTLECCSPDVAAARAKYPTKNLAYLPFFGVAGP